MLGARLEELLDEEEQNQNNVVSMVTDEFKQRQLLLEDEEEDFLDEGEIEREFCRHTFPRAFLEILNSSLQRQTFNVFPSATEAESNRQESAPWP